MMMIKKLKLLASGVLVLAAAFANAETPAEVKLIAACDGPVAKANKIENEVMSLFMI